MDITRILPEDFKLEAGNPVAWNRAGALDADHRGTLPPEAGVTWPLQCCQPPCQDWGLPLERPTTLTASPVSIAKPRRLRDSSDKFPVCPSHSCLLPLKPLKQGLFRRSQTRPQTVLAVTLLSFIYMVHANRNPLGLLNMGGTLLQNLATVQVSLVWAHVHVCVLVNSVIFIIGEGIRHTCLSTFSFLLPKYRTVTDSRRLAIQVNNPFWALLTDSGRQQWYLWPQFYNFFSITVS